jgi:hypothetical protein
VDDGGVTRIKPLVHRKKQMVLGLEKAVQKKLEPAFKKNSNKNSNGKQLQEKKTRRQALEAMAEFFPPPGPGSGSGAKAARAEYGDLDIRTVPDLKQFCSNAGLEQTGQKQVLVDRLARSGGGRIGDGGSNPEPGASKVVRLELLYFCTFWYRSLVDFGSEFIRRVQDLGVR